MAAKRARMRPEPSPAEPGVVRIRLQLPSGLKFDRRWRASTTIQQVRDALEVWVDDQQEPRQPKLEEEMYELASTYPRERYVDHDATLSELGLSGLCALRVEVSD